MLLAVLVAISFTLIVVKVAQAFFNAPAVDVYIKGTRAFANVRPFNVTRYTVLITTTYNFRVEGS